MQPKLKKKLSLLLVLVLMLSLFSGLTFNAGAESTGTATLAFASDVHHDTDNSKNNTDEWLKSIQTKGVVSSIDYMGFCGDIGSAYDSGSAYWADAQVVMNVVDGYVASGYIDKAEFTMGNHEWFTEAGGDYGLYNGNPAYEVESATCARFLRIGESENTADYITYCFGSYDAVATDHSAYGYGTEDISTLETYLESAPDDIPIFIMGHFPLHSFGGRHSVNASLVIDVLNQHPNAVFVYGHNHSVFDTYYDQINEAGDYLDVSGTPTQIKFTYTSAGCMSDSEYGAGSKFVQGKGLIVSINGDDVTFTHYKMDGTPVNDTKTIDMATVGTDLSATGPYTVKFKDGQTNQMIEYQTVARGAGAIEPAHVKYDGYIYTGWDRDFSNVTQNMTVTATYIEKPVPLAAQSTLDPNYIYISLYVNADPAVGTSGSPIIFYPVLWEEGLTINDAVFKIHELEYTDGTAGVAINSENGFDCYSTLWGHTPKYNALTFDSTSWVDGAKETAGGDVYYLLAYDEDWITTSFLTPNTTEAVTGEYITMQAQTMNMNSDYTYTPKGFAGDIYAGTSLDSLTDTGINSDSRGTFTISFDQPGKYYVVAKSSSRGTAIGVVNVTESSGEYVYINLSIDGTVAHGKDGSYIAHYPMVLHPGATVGEIMTRLHAHAYGAGNAWTANEADGTTTIFCLWGLDYETNCGNIYINNSPQPVNASTILSSGDVLDVNGFNAERTRASMFDIKYAEIAVDEEIILTAMNAGPDGYQPNSLTPIFVDFEATSYVTGTDGRVTMSFDKDGTYIVTGDPLLNAACPVCVIKVGEGGPMANFNDIPEGTPVGTVYFYAVMNDAILKDTDGNDIVYYPVSMYAGDTIADAITTLHKDAYGDASGWGYQANSVFGHDLNMLWGQSIGSTYGGGVWTDFSAYTHADVTQPAADGMIVYLNSYTDSSATYYRCGFFDTPYMDVAAGDTVTLTMQRGSGDGTAKPCAGSAVYVDGDAAGTTDTSGKITLTFNTPGKHVVTGAPGRSWTTAVCLVNVAVGRAYCYGALDAGILTDTKGTQIVKYPVFIYEGDTIADVITRLHEIATGDGEGWSYKTNNVFGHDLTMLWGQPIGSTYGGGVWTDFTQYRHADVTQPAAAGMMIYLNSYTGSSGTYFRCGFFDKQDVTLYTGDSLTLTMRRASGDGTAKANGSNTVSIDGVSAGTTDASGKITLTFSTPGTYLVTGTSGSSWTTAICLVTVTDKPLTPVNDITGVPASGFVGTPLALSGTVAPAEATNQTISWSVKSGDASITDGNQLTASAAGDVVVTATVVDGISAGADFTKDFTITIISTTPAPTISFSLFTLGTAGNPSKVSGISDLVVSAGHVFVTDYNNGRIVEYDEAGNYVAFYGKKGSGLNKFTKPLGISVDENGYIYVADSGNNRIVRFLPVAGAITEWQTFGTLGSGEGQLKKPLGVFVKNSTVYVTDTGNSRVVTFDTAGGSWQAYGTKGSGDGQFNNLYDVVADDAGNIWVSDTLNKRVVMLDASGNFVTAYTGYNMPYGLAIDEYGNVFVADRQDGTIKCVNGTAVYGGKGSGAGKFTNPVGLFIDADKGLWVVDVTASKVQHAQITY